MSRSSGRCVEPFKVISFDSSQFISIPIKMSTAPILNFSARVKKNCFQHPAPPAPPTPQHPQHHQHQPNSITTSSFSACSFIKGYTRTGPSSLGRKTLFTLLPPLHKRQCHVHVHMIQRVHPQGAHLKVENEMEEKFKMIALKELWPIFHPSCELCLCNAKQC